MILGKCHHCRKSIYYLVDLLRGSHEKCDGRHNAGVRKIVSKIRHASEFGGNLRKLDKEIQGIARSSYIKEKDISKHVFEGWESAARDLLKGGVPSELAEKNLLAVSDHFTLPEKKLRKSEAYRNLMHLPFLREVRAGLYPPMRATDNDYHFNFYSSETIVREFANVEYYEEVTRTEIQYDTDSSRSNQDSIRTVGRQINRTSIELIDRGALVLSNMHLYFVGSRRRFRIPYHRIAVLNRDRVRILGIKVGPEVINVTQDGPQAKPQQFRMDEVWFAYNLLVILARQ